MCGIAGVYVKNPRAANNEGMERFANELLLEIEARGRHATGFVAVNRIGEVILDKAAITASDFIQERDAFPKDVQTILLHTRFKTKGDQKELGNNHPVTYNTCFAIHNGCIFNDDSLFKSEKLKRNYEVDTEIIPAILDKHGLDTPEHIREALEKFEGSMAIAAIDPIKHLGRLVLARGESSPLYVFENTNVIIWASSHLAIKTAWGKVVGTPPRDDRIKFLSGGKFLVADSDAKASTEYEFEVPELANRWARGNIRNTGLGIGRGTGFGATFRRPWDSGGPFNSRKDFDEALAITRKETGGVRTWAKRSSYDNTDLLKDVEGVISWHSCMCGSSVLREDMTHHLNYGNICKDCYKTIINGWQSKADKDPKAEKVGKAVGKARCDAVTISVLDRRHLENWVRTESKFHRYVLSDLCDLSGISIAALDFLLFRTTKIESDFGAAMVVTKAELRKVYDELLEELHTEFGKEVIEEAERDKAVTVAEAQKIADDLMHPWEAYTYKSDGGTEVIHYVCTEHGEVFDFGESCHSCDGAEAANEEGWPGEDQLNMGWCGGGEPYSDTPGAGIEVFAEEENVRTLCPQCKTMKRVNRPCSFCVAKKVTQNAAKMLTPPSATEEPDVAVIACSCKQTRNRKCKRKLAFVLSGGVFEKSLGYCRPHWVRCSYGKCNRSANFTALNGRRYCHIDSRGRQGVHDNGALKSGALLQEVV